VKFELLTRWQTWTPIIALMLGVFGGVLPETLGLVLVVSALVVTVLAAVYHAEVIAERVGEPYGTLVLAVAVTIIEVALIISLMLSTETPTPTIVRDTVFAAVMIIITGMVGLCMLAGAWQHGEQTFTRRGVSAALATLSALAVLSPSCSPISRYRPQEARTRRSNWLSSVSSRSCSTVRSSSCRRYVTANTSLTKFTRKFWLRMKRSSKVVRRSSTSSVRPSA